MAGSNKVRVNDIPIPGANAWGQRCLRVLAYGSPDARPKAYLQASLHADEIPGMLVLNHLCQLLNATEESIVGEIIILPVANPLGLSQIVSGKLVGRYALSGAGNYNRHFPALATPVGERVADLLGADAERNIELIRTTMQEILAEQTPLDETQWLRHRLLSLSIDADIVLDLHCDSEALLHCYFGTPLWPDAEDLSRQMGSEASLLATDSGGFPFDEAVAGPWWTLAEQFPQWPVPPACLSTTIELRGARDVNDQQARADATNLFKFLQRRGLIEGDPGDLPEPLCPATPLDAVEMVRAPVGGVVSQMARLGTEVKKGDCIATITDPMEVHNPQSRFEIQAQTDGVLFAHTQSRFVAPGQVLCKLAGSVSLASRKAGQLLTD